MVVLFILSVCYFFCHAQPQNYMITSPDKKIVVTCNPGQARYNISYNGEVVLKDSTMKNFTNDDILKLAVFLPVLVPIYLAYACFRALKAVLEFQD